MHFPNDAHLKYVATTTTFNPLRRLWPEPKRDLSVPLTERPGLLIWQAGPFLPSRHSDQAKCRIRPAPSLAYLRCIRFSAP
jgi:hypothetical protein